MKYDDPELLDALAAEYVLGTLRGAARRRFIRLLETSRQAHEAVDHWQEILGGLGSALAPQEPPARVWQRIEARLDIADDAAAARASASASVSSAWLPVALAASLAAVLLAGWLLSMPPAERPGHVAVFEDADEQPMWVITADADTGVIRARAINAEAAAVDRAYELWMLPAQGPPRSLGLLPVSGDVTRHDIPPALRALLSEAQGLAVSLEPAGGSPTGAPTGPVLFQAPVLEL